MACVSPLHIKWKSNTVPMHLRNIIYRSGNDLMFDVPCGWCLNCRVDRRNWLEDAINYELKTKYKGIASFVTLTYDDIHIHDLTCYSIDNPSMLPVVELNESGSIKYTLKNKHAVDFIKRLRSYVSYHKPHGINPKFKVVYCSEYGGKYQRPHFHFLFLGCDDRFLYNVLQKTWKNGIIDSGPLDNGGIRYVLDYVEKQVHGSAAELMYDKQGLERPVLHYSKGLGKSLILDNLKDILDNDLTYCCGSFNKRRPIPSYYKRLLLQHSKNANKKQVDRLNYISTQISRPKPKSLKEYNALRHELSLAREKKLINKIRYNGSPVDDTYLYHNYRSSSFGQSYQVLVEQAQKLSSLYKNYNCSLQEIEGDKIPF